MKVLRFQYVIGLGKRKHILIGKQGDPPLCGVWYFGKGTGKHNLAIAKPKSGTPQCQSCVRAVLKLTTGFSKKTVVKEQKGK